MTRESVDACQSAQGSVDGRDLDESLAEYDENLRQGVVHPRSIPEFLKDPDADSTVGFVACLNFLERVWPRGGESAPGEMLPARIGRFEIRRVLGHGGFGVVYLAHDPVLQRAVALKVPRLHSLADTKLRERFHREARAAATLDHPNIVPIYETGQDGPIEYIASAYCDGPPLDSWLRQQTVPLRPSVAAALVATLADAAHYSHSRGVLHQDLKPGNVLLVPVAADVERAKGTSLPFTPRITDFGLARLMDDCPGESAASAMLGTPAYMAPEQLRGADDATGPHTDVYALGVLLYELLTGRPPFQGSGVADVLDQIRHREPVAPRRVRRDIPRDLETICLKCLEKPSRQRFISARELSEELGRFLRGEPLATRPPGWSRRTYKWVRRRPMATALIALVAMTAIAVPLMLLVHNQRLASLAQELRLSLAKSTRLQAEAELTRAEVELRRQSAADVAYASAVRLAELAWREGDVRQARALLNLAAEQATPETRTGLEWKFIDYQISASCRELGDPNADCLCTGISPDGRVIALGDTAGRVQLIDFQSGRTVRVLDTPHGSVRCLRFNAAGTQLASCGDDRILCVWNPESGEQLFTSPAAPSALQSLCWVRQDGWIAAAGGIGFPGVFLWKVDEGTTESLGTGDERVTSLTTSTDQQYLAAGGHDGSIWIWEQADPSLVCRAEYDRSKVTGLAFSRDGRSLAVGGTDQMVRFFAFDGHALHETDEWQLRDDIRDVSCSPIDESLVVLDQFGSIHLANATPDVGKGAREKGASAMRGLRSWEAHERRGWQVDFMPNRLQLVSSGGDGPARLWDVETKRQPAQLPLEASDKGYEHPLLFTADGRLITAERAVRMWSVDDLAPGHTFDHDGSRAWCLAVSPDGRRLAVGAANAGVLEIHDLKSLAADTLLRVPLPRVDSVAFSPADDVLAVADWKHDTVTIIECESGRSLQTLPARQCHEVAYSPDGRWLAVDDQDDIVVWDARSFAVEARLQGHLSTILSLTFSPDGQWLASGSRDREIRLWSAADWQFVRGLHGHRSEVQIVRFTPDSRSLIALDGDEYVKVWDPSTGSEVCNLRTPADGPVSRFAISPDTEHLAVRLPDGRVELQRLWVQPTSSRE